MSHAHGIAMVRRHFAEGEKHVASQRDIILRLREIGAETAIAGDLLAEFEATLAQHRAHLAKLLAR